MLIMPQTKSSHSTNPNYKYLLKPGTYFSFKLDNYNNFLEDSKKILDDNNLIIITDIDGKYDAEIPSEYKLFTDENLPETVAEYKFSTENNNVLYIGAFNYSFDEKNQNTIDNIRNYSSLNSIEEYFSKNSGVETTSSDIFEYAFNKGKLYDIYPLLQQYSDDLSIKSEYQNLDDLYDFDFSKFIYRASPNNSLSLNNLTEDIKINSDISLKSYYKSIDNNNPGIPSVFMYKTNNSDPKFFLSCRNIYIPCKRIQVSLNEGSYTFIFIFPEYMLKAGDSLNGIKEIFYYSSAIFSTEDTPTIYYSYAHDSSLYPENDLFSYFSDDLKDNLGTLNGFIFN